MHGIPDLLTVEEAARLIRVGRTKAYAMTREWRATDGRSGLPCVDFGHVLRVPRHALEELIGAHLDDDDRPAAADVGSGRGDTSGPRDAALSAPPGDASPEPDPRDSRAERPSRKRASNSPRASNRSSNQLDLFGPSDNLPAA